MNISRLFTNNEDKASSKRIYLATTLGPQLLADEVVNLATG